MQGNIYPTNAGAGINHGGLAMSPASCLSLWLCQILRTAFLSIRSEVSSIDLGCVSFFLHSFNLRLFGLTFSQISQVVLRLRLCLRWLPFTFYCVPALGHMTPPSVHIYLLQLRGFHDSRAINFSSLLPVSLREQMIFSKKEVRSEKMIIQPNHWQHSCDQPPHPKMELLFWNHLKRSECKNSISGVCQV